MRRACGIAVLALAAIAACVNRDEPNHADMQLAKQMIDELRAEHIAANVPGEEDFDRVLRRDLAAYFGAGPGAGQVEYTLLRDGATQVGVAFPKFYAWVRVARDGVETDGAVRLAAISKERFDVTHFIERSAIASNPDAVRSVFPPDVADRILANVAMEER